MLGHNSERRVPWDAKGKKQIHNGNGKVDSRVGSFSKHQEKKSMAAFNCYMHSTAICRIVRLSRD